MTNGLIVMYTGCLAMQVAGAVASGKVAVVDFYGQPDELPIIQRMYIKYIEVMKRKFAPSAITTHRLYLRIK